MDKGVNGSRSQLAANIARLPELLRGGSEPEESKGLILHR